MSKFAFCLIGPTASGKTGLACELVQHFPFEIISIDSAMIYREMNIGTAKPDASILTNAPHHLIDIINPPDAYSVARCLQDVESLCDEIINRGNIPLLVGGTMMYFNALQNGLSPLPEASAIHRQQILADAKQYGWQYVHQMLNEVDPKSASRINPNDTQRIQRALEVYQITNQPLSSLLCQNHSHINMQFVNITLIPSERSWLHARINERFKLMLDEGLIAEVENLVRKWSLFPESPSMRCVGYRQVFSYLRGEIEYTSMIDQGCAATRQLAKRQLTWLRKWPNVHEFFADGPSNLPKIMELIGKILDNSEDV
ncbi:MAG: tRNA (adenosine(37)-N6)-dimethylallyltransferase MiaA [Legionellaceae bacterium]|nr:tRNA (adenosine(37)-N6)-dimethylallyltransferase MiaA [Legionellaceae bacterium]